MIVPEQARNAPMGEIDKWRSRHSRRVPLQVTGALATHATRIR